MAPKNVGWGRSRVAQALLGLIRGERDSKVPSARHGSEPPVGGEPTDEREPGDHAPLDTPEPRGDFGEFDEIAKRHKAYLHRVAVNLSRNDQDAKDLVQDTLIQAWKHFAEFEQGTNARAWMVVILKNRFLDRLKHERVVSNALRELGPHDDFVCDSATGSERDAYLEAAIDALPAKLRAAVKACYIEDRTYEEAAQLLGISTGTLGSRLHTARQRIKKSLLKMMPDLRRS